MSRNCGKFDSMAKKIKKMVDKTGETVMCFDRKTAEILKTYGIKTVIADKPENLKGTHINILRFYSISEIKA